MEAVITSPDPLLGRTLDDRYRIAEVIDAGGMATVYRAEAVRLGRDVAVKVIHPHLADNAAFVQRFAREAKALARLNHPNVVQIFDQGEWDGRPYIAMEYVDGESLKSLLGTRAKFTVSEALGVAVQVSQGLAQAHRLGLIHRDIKPANILLDPDGRAKLADFGISRALGETALTNKGAVMGTIAYMAPELLREALVTPAADVYALGITLYELVAGLQPFAGMIPVEAVNAKESKPLPPLAGLPGVPAELDPLLAWLTAAQLSRRPADATEILDPIRQLAAGLGGVDQLATGALGQRVTAKRQATLGKPAQQPSEVPAAAATAAVEAPQPVTDDYDPTRVNPLVGPANPVRYPAAPNAPTQVVSLPPEAPVTPGTKVMPSPTVRVAVEKPRRKIPVLGILIVLVILALLGGVAYLGFAGGWLPRLLGLPTAAASAQPSVSEEPGTQAADPGVSASPEPVDSIELVTPAAVTTQPTVQAEADNPLDVTAPNAPEYAAFHWDMKQLFLHANASVAWVEGKQLPTRVYVTGGTTYIDFSQYPFTRNISIDFMSVAGDTIITLPADVNVSIKWTSARGTMTLEDGLDGGKAWTNAEQNGSRTIKVNDDAPTVTIKLTSPSGNYSLQTKE
jgi:serine/threonine protein kinase